MRLRGKINPVFVAIIFSLAPFYSLCVDHNVTLPEKHVITHDKNVIAHDKVNVSNVNSSLPGHVHVNDSVAHLTANSTEGKSRVPAPERKSKPVISSSSSTTHEPSKNESVHAAGRENVPLKVDHTTKPGGRQVMEGGGTLHDLDPKNNPQTTPVKGLVKAHNLTMDVHDIPKTSLEPHKNISPRKGAPVEMLPEKLPPVVVVSSTTTSRPVTRKMKPLYTMVKGDKFSKESESFIESPTTGKDYVLPLVLIIFAVPGFVFLVKFLYKRGTEFTERQQYHRMYLIDGDYRTPFLERWGRVMKNIFWADNLQTVNLTNFGDVSLNPRMNYHSF